MVNCIKTELLGLASFLSTIYFYHQSITFDLIIAMFIYFLYVNNHEDALY